MNVSSLNRYVGLGWCCLAAAANQAKAEAPETPRPNFLIINVDDLPYHAAGYTGRHPFLDTPSIDRIRHEGVLFSNAFVPTSICVPSRASLLTGAYPSRHGVAQNGAGEYDADDTPPFPLVLQQHGYHTAHVGKWHMLNTDTPRVGYDYWAAFAGQGPYFDPVMNVNGDRNLVEGYVTDVLTDHAIDYLENVRDSEKPFMLYIGHKATHEPYTPAPRHAGLYDEVFYEAPPNHSYDFAGKPSWYRHPVQWIKDVTMPIPDTIDPPDNWNGHMTINRRVFETLLAVDESIGAVLDKIESLGLLDNTVVIYTSDNGLFMGEHNRRDKRLAYEESIRVPFLIRYPELFATNSTREEFTVNVDVAPTILELADAEIPAHVQGASLLPLLTNGGDPEWRDHMLYTYWLDNPPTIPSMLGVRSATHKLVEYPLLGEAELYDLIADPYELDNRYNDPALASVQSALEGKLAEKAEQYGYALFVPRADGRDHPDIAVNESMLVQRSGNDVILSGASTPVVFDVIQVTDAPGEPGLGLSFNENSVMIAEAFNSMRIYHLPIRMEVDFTPASDGMIFSAGETGSAISLLMEDGAPLLALHRGNGAYVMKANTNALGQRLLVEIDVTTTTTQFRVNGNMIASYPIVAPFRIFRPAPMVFGYSAADTPSDTHLKSYPQEQVIPSTTADYVLHAYSFDKGTEASAFDTTMVTSGDPRVAENWSDGLPGTSVSGHIPSGVTGTVNEAGTVLMAALLTIDGALEQWGAGALVMDANSAVTVRGNGRVETAVSHFRINRGPLTVNGGTVDSAGNVDLYGTGSFFFLLQTGVVTAGGNIILNPNVAANPDSSRHLRVRGGAMTATALNLTENADLYFDGSGGQVSVQTLNVDGNAYINFVGDTEATLTVTGFNAVDFEGLYTSDQLRRNSSSADVFDDVFEVVGSTLAVKVLLPDENTMIASGDPRVADNWSHMVPDTANPGIIPSGITATFNEGSNISFPAVLTITGTLRQLGAGVLLFDANSAITVGESGLAKTYGNHFRINRGPLTVNGGTVESAGNVDLYGTGQFALTLNGGTVAADGNVVMNPNLGADPDSTRQIRIRAGSISGNGLILQDAASVVFDGTGGQITVNALTRNGDAYIDFQGGTTGTLTIANFTSADFEDLFNAGALRRDGSSTGAFDDHFVLDGSTVSARAFSYQSFEEWADEAGLPPDQRGWDDDPYGTGVKNLVAYTTGISQQEPVRGPLAIRFDEGRPVILLPWRTNIAPDAYFMIELSGDLAEWKDDTDLVWDTAPLDEGRVEMQGRHEPDGTDQQFYRLHIGTVD